MYLCKHANLQGCMHARLDACQGYARLPQRTLSVYPSALAASANRTSCDAGASHPPSPLSKAETNAQRFEVHVLYIPSCSFLYPLAPFYTLLLLYIHLAPVQETSECGPDRCSQITIGDTMIADQYPAQIKARREIHSRLVGNKVRRRAGV